MPLDPALRKILRAMPNTNIIGYNSIDIEEYRKNEEIESRNTKIDTPDLETSNHSIEVEKGNIVARLYSPRNSSEALLVFFHGGGFVFGTLDSYDYICRTMAKHSGCKVLSVGYRLAPDYKFPTAVNDAFSSYMWAREHAPELRIDDRRIAVAGDSAGGNLAAAVSLMCKDLEKPLPALQLLLYPVLGYDITSNSIGEFSEGYNLNNSYTRWFTDKYIRDDADLSNPYFSIMSHPDLSGLPETIVFTAEFDILRDLAEAFVYGLRAANTEATGIRALGMFHAFASHISTSTAARNFLIMACKLVADKLQ